METNIFIDNFAADGSFSILKKIFNPDTFTVENHREAITPGQFERAAEVLPAHMNAVINAIWTPEILSDWAIKHPIIEPVVEIEEPVIFAPPLKRHEEIDDTGELAEEYQPPVEEPAEEIDPPVEEPAEDTDPPVDEPVEEIDPPVDEPAEEIDPPVDEPAEDTDPPVDEPAEEIDSPVDEPVIEQKPEEIEEEINLDFEDLFNF
jgi:hypothetical protein